MKDLFVSVLIALMILVSSSVLADIHQLAVGQIISIEKKLEYEILLIYVDKKFRKLGFASKLINVVSKFPYLYPLCKITLEVSENNIAAINLYKKNKFSHIGERKNYYNINKNFNENALIFEKKINE